jgi:hypothetical protein
MTNETEITDDGFAPDDAAGMTDEELRALLEEAKVRGDEPLRRLLASYITLRRLAAEMLTLIEAREGAIVVVRTPLFARLRHLTRRSAR